MNVPQYFKKIFSVLQTNKFEKYLYIFYLECEGPIFQTFSRVIKLIYLIKYYKNCTVDQQITRYLKCKIYKIIFPSR